MTLRDFQAQVASMSHLHPLTPVCIDDLRTDAGVITGTLWEDDRDERIAELLESEKELTEELRAAEAERDEWERQLKEAETTLENSPDAFLFAQTQESAERFREMATMQAEELALLRAEVSAIRKRKGVAAGVCAYSRDVWSLLCYVSQGTDRYADTAKQLIEKINAL